MIKAIIVDDDLISLNILTEYLKKSSGLEVVGTFSSPYEAMKFASLIKIDAAFLDIEMPGMDGLTLAEHLLDFNYEAAIVFATAFSKYAVKAFRLNALDYLMKPFEEREIDEALKRITKDAISREKQSVIKVFCFGKFRVMTSEEQQIKWRTNKAEEIFAYLIDKRDNEATTDELIENIFGDFDFQKAYNYLKISIHYIRKTFIELGYENIIKNTRGAYKLELKGVWCDYYEFNDIASTTKKIDRKNVENAERVVRLYIGDYLEGNYYKWAGDKEELIQSACIRLILDIAEHYKNIKKYQNAIEILKIGLRIDPVNREINVKMVSVYKAENDYLNARRQYEEYKKRMRIELWDIPERDK